MAENDFNIEDIELFPIQEAYIAEIQAAQAAPQATEEVTAADLINSGHYAHPYVPLFVSSMSEQAAQEEELIQHMASQIQETINNYGAPQTDESPSPELVMAPTFEIASNPTVSLEEIKARRFNIVDGGKYVKPIPEGAYLFDNMENRFNLMDFD